MSEQPRVAKVLAALLLSMTIGALVLIVLRDTPPSAGPFELSSYYRLDPVKQALLSGVAQLPDRWSSIEVYYSQTKAGNVEQLATLSGLASTRNINCHFCICNGLGGLNGQIQSTEKWQRQWSAIPGRTWYGSSQTIRICVIADGDTATATDTQIRRTEALVEALSRKFDIHPQSIHYPINWR